LRSFDSPIDDDWLKIELKKPSRLRIQTSAFAGRNVDTVLTLYDDELNLIMENDDENPQVTPGSFSKVESEALAAGEYFIKVNHFRLPGGVLQAPTVANYVLNIRILDKNISLGQIYPLLLDD